MLVLGESLADVLVSERSIYWPVLRTPRNRPVSGDTAVVTVVVYLLFPLAPSSRSLGVFYDPAVASAVA